ncbi:hypothetical protein GA0061105_10936 [Rhizobium aethiopicum]|uniref:Uncharacterized protein n=1 Tax=Rhizobium aethiopicum TaxID=1138170 RepID=A0A1C3Y6A5_9HYPH|nr:hypothetical protein GA0061105_10936 [Rhizobium aethiopicum]
MLDTTVLNDFIVEAKAATYVGGGVPRLPCRPGAHDIGYFSGNWGYSTAISAAPISPDRRWCGLPRNRSGR